MLNITKKVEDKVVTFMLDGRLDTVTAPQLEKAIKEEINGVVSLIFDFEKLEYISSAGLRVLLSAQKVMNAQGQMKLLHVNRDVMDIFEMTGFSEVLSIE